MGILENGRDGPLSIERMIFHLVGLDGDEGPTVLEEISPPEHEEFFLERIRSALLQTFAEASTIAAFEVGKRATRR